MTLLRLFYIHLLEYSPLLSSTDTHDVNVGSHLLQLLNKEFLQTALNKTTDLAIITYFMDQLCSRLLGSICLKLSFSIDTSHKTSSSSSGVTSVLKSTLFICLQNADILREKVYIQDTILCFIRLI